MGVVELLGVGLGASGWVTAVVLAVLWQRQTAALGDARREADDITRQLLDVETQLAKEAREHARWESEAARLADDLRVADAARVADAPASDLGDLSSRGGGRVPADGDGRATGAAPGPVPTWARPNPGDPSVPGGGQ